MGSASSGFRRMRRRKSSRRILSTLSGLGHAGGEIRPLPGDQVQLPQEATGAERGDDGVAVEARTDHLRPSVEDHEEVVGGVPRPVQDIAAFDRLLLAERAQLGEGVGI